MNTPRPPDGPDIQRLRAAISAQLFTRSPTVNDDDVVDGRYRLLENIGRGSMATVWRARDEHDGSEVAIKLLRSRDLFAGSAVARMLREAELAGSIVHPHVVRVLGHGPHQGGGAYVVMELVDGESLAAVLEREGALPWPRARDVLLQIADALAAAHARGVVHRDLKPANVIVTRAAEGLQCKVIDFGLARPIGVDPSTGKLTGTGLVFGTPRYMSPEQVRATEIDGRADVYAFGCLAYEVVTGVPAASAAMIGDVLIEHLSRHPRRFAEVAPGIAVPAGVEAIVRRATRKDRELRFASMCDLHAALLAVDDGHVIEVPEESLAELAPPDPPKSHRRLWVVSLVLAAGALFGAYSVIA
jgi:serine/threonine-protein kinase